MKTRKILSLFLILLMLTAGVGCEGKDFSDETEETMSDTFEQSPGDEVDMTGYTLIRSDMSSKEVTDSYILIKKTLSNLCGVDLAVTTDFESDDPANRNEKEIIVGHTNLPEENAIYDTLQEGEYAIQQVGSKIVIVGYTDKETVYAVKRFLELTVGYNQDKYENQTLGTSLLSIPSEHRAMEKISYPSGRVVSTLPVMTSEVIKPMGYNEDIGGVRWTSTGSLEILKDTGEGSYRVEFTVDIRNDNMPVVQMFTNSARKSDYEHICVGISGNSVKIGRATYERGGAEFTGDPKHYVFRMDVHPESGRMQYFVNGKFLGEMNAGDSDDPLIEHSIVSLAAVGNDMDVVISDIRIENIEDIGGRRYSAPEKVLTLNDDIYPKSQNAPGEVIYVVEGTRASNSDILTITTLQGNVNRTTPEIFMDYRSYNQDPRHADIAEEEAYIELLRQKGRTVENADIEELLVKFADRYQGVIVGDAFATVYGENVVTSLCGVLDAVYLTEKQYDSLKDKIKKDVLFRIDDYWDSPMDAYMWVWNTYGDRFSDQVFFHTPSMIEQTGHNSRACRDYAVMCRAFTFYTHGVECIEDYDFVMNIFATRAANSGVIGFGGGCFPEFEMFQVCGQFAKFWTYGFSTANMSLFNSLEFGELKQKQAASDVQLENDTVYVTFDLSEGDNLSWNYHLWAQNFANEAGRAAYPKGYSLCGALYYLAPALIEYFYDIATVNDYFFFDGGSVSNIGSPDSYAVMYRDSDREYIMSEMLKLLNHVCEKADISIVRAINNISEEMALRIDEECPAIRSLFSSYGNTVYAIGGSGGKYRQSIRMEGDIVRVRCHLTNFQPDLDIQLTNLARQVRAEDGIMFAKTFIYANSVLYDIADLKKYTDELEKSGKHIVYVRPDEFVELYREYSARTEN